MKTLGQVIRTYREKKGWSVARLARETSISADTLQSLEKEEFTQLPAGPLVRGYVQLIARSLEIPEETAIALWRRDAPAEQTNELQPESERLPLRHRSFWQPRTVAWFGFLSILIIVATVLLWQWNEIGKPPALTVQNLENFSLLSTPIEVTGQTDPDATVTINTQLVSLDPQGRFRYELEIPPGERTIVVQATDAQGRTAEAVYFVTVE